MYKLVSDEFGSYQSPLGGVSRSVRDSSFFSFVRKLKFDANDRVFFHGDFHGDIVSMVSILKFLFDSKLIENDFKLASDVKLVFLGDYTDRGSFGIDVLATVFYLKQKNPHSVILIRGNHEDKILTDQFGFKKEMDEFVRNAKTNELEIDKQVDDTLYGRIHQIYSYLPTALFFNTKVDEGSDQKWMLASHGGYEWGIVGLKDLLSESSVDQILIFNKLNRSQFPGLTRVFKSEGQIIHKFLKFNGPINGLVDIEERFPSLGFAWHDYQLSSSQQSTYVGYRGLKSSKCAFEAFRDELGIWGHFRAHQHSQETMEMISYNDGILPHFEKPYVMGASGGALPEGVVLTFTLGADSRWGNEYKMTFTALGELRFMAGKTLQEQTFINHRIELLPLPSDSDYEIEI